MTVYYCDEWIDDTGEYMPMNNVSAQVLSLNIEEAVSAYEFQTRHLSGFEIDIDSALPIVFDMLSIKNKFIERHDRFISGLMLKIYEQHHPTYYDDLNEIDSDSIDLTEEVGDPSSDIITIEVFANAIMALGQVISSIIYDVAYTGNYLAYNLYSYENGNLTLVVNHVPVYRTKHIAKIVELSTNKVLAKYGKTIGSE